MTHYIRQEKHTDQLQTRVEDESEGRKRSHWLGGGQNTGRN